MSAAREGESYNHQTIQQGCEDKPDSHSGAVWGGRTEEY